MARWTPSVVPNIDDQNVYLVVDDFGRLGRAYRETDVEEANLEASVDEALLASETKGSGESRSGKDEAADFLRELLAAGAMPVLGIEQEAPTLAYWDLTAR